MEYIDDAEECKTVPELVEFYRNWILNDIRKEVIKMEKTYNCLKSYHVDTETLDEALYCMEEYYSDTAVAAGSCIS
jgi:hypothetical protein